MKSVSRHLGIFTALCVTVALWTAAGVGAHGAWKLPAEAAPAAKSADARVPANESDLEAKYAALYLEKVQAETERVSKGKESLFYGTTVVLVGLVLLALYALAAARRQQGELDRLRVEVKGIAGGEKTGQA